ncbi:MAG: cytochrome B [Candidatus Marinimicrobia bacterium]|nr:cytochrome B [Candidatus Neomarinimicrobiota bacterium]|tara:strand:- start:10091 stop:10702 length:612 start_codon:yes stop_codon:yes gene_type:complete
MNLIRKLYDWVLHWAQTPFGPLVLFILAFAESSFFPIPPDVLLIALALGVRNKSMYFAFLCSIASIAGGICGYGIGYFLWWEGSTYSDLAHFFFNNVPGFSKDLFTSVQNQYNEHGFFIIFTAGFTPIPYKIFTITAGAFNIDLINFVIASTVSRSARFFLVASLIWRFGESIKSFIDKYFNILTIVFTILLIGGFLLIKVLI